MADSSGKNSKMPKGRPFLPGQSGNPGGRPKLPADLKEARIQNAKEIEALMYKYMGYSVEALKSALGDPATPARDLIVIRILSESIKHGDEKRFDFILNRTIGKVVEKIDHTVEAKPSILVRKDGTEVLFTTTAKKEDEK